MLIKELSQGEVSRAESLTLRVRKGQVSAVMQKEGNFDLDIIPEEEN